MPKKSSEVFIDDSSSEESCSEEIVFEEPKKKGPKKNTARHVESDDDSDSERMCELCDEEPVSTRCELCDQGGICDNCWKYCSYCDQKMCVACETTYSHEESCEDKPTKKEKKTMLPNLYVVDKKGKTRVWKIWTRGPTVYKSYGEEGGKATPSERTFKGVNLGKRNETSPAEQALRKAERDWVKQLDKSYFPKCSEGKAMAKKAQKAKTSQNNTNAGVSDVFRGTAKKATAEKSSTAKATATKKAERKKENGSLPGYETKFTPMGCQVWSEDAKVLKYFDLEDGPQTATQTKSKKKKASARGVWVQPKLDGIRALVSIVPDSAGKPRVVMITRNGKQLVWLNHLREQVLVFLRDHPDVILDCEVYAEHIYGEVEVKGTGKTQKLVYHDSDLELPQKQRFDVISGGVRPVRGEPHALEKQLCLYVFDIADPTGELTQDERFAIRDELFETPKVSKLCPSLKKVETRKVKTVAEIGALHAEFAEKEFEGVVIRARNLKYDGGRKSLQMRKHKLVMDEEFIVEGAEKDDGVPVEHFVWVCSVRGPDGKKRKFTVKPMGTREQKQVWWSNRKKFIGQPLTVRFQDKTVDGVPRFPRGHSIRDYE